MYVGVKAASANPFSPLLAATTCSGRRNAERGPMSTCAASASHTPVGDPPGAKTRATPVCSSRLKPTPKRPDRPTGTGPGAPSGAGGVTPGGDATGEGDAYAGTGSAAAAGPGSGGPAAAPGAPARDAARRGDRASASASCLATAAAK